MVGRLSFKERKVLQPFFQANPVRTSKTGEILLQMVPTGSGLKD